MAVRLSIIMISGGYREKYHLIDYLNNQTIPREDYELMWIEFYGETREELRGKSGVKLVTLGNSRDTVYHSSKCFNEGIRRSRGEILVIPDADVIVEPTFIEAVIKEHEKCDRLAMYFRRWNEPKERYDELKSYDLDYARKVCVCNSPYNYGGCITVRKKWLIEINGYDEDSAFGTSFHANGYDVNTRLKNLGIHVMWHPKERIYHPWHPVSTEGGDIYVLQHSITRQREINGATLPNRGLDPLLEKRNKEKPILTKKTYFTEMFATVLSKFRRCHQ